MQSKQQRINIMKGTHFLLEQFYLKMEVAMNSSGMGISYRTMAAEGYINEKTDENT